MRQTFNNCRKAIAGTVNFLTLGIWRMKLTGRPKRESFLIGALRVVILSLKEFHKDKCQLRASALTFYTLLSIVPVLAMAFGVAKGFGFEGRLRNQLLERFADQGEVIIKAIDFADNLLANTSGGLVAGVGVVLLLWAVIKVLGNIEHSFNAIWGVKKGRHLGRKFTDYISVIVLAPLLLIMSGSITLLVKSRFLLVMDKIALRGAFEPLFNLAPYIVVWLLFTFLYLFMPNTKVKWSAGVVAGIVAGTIYQIVQLIYIGFQIGVAKYGAIYGSFAALPLFLVWLQMSWIVVLYGAELSFAYQNVHTYEFEIGSLGVSQAFKKLLSLRVVHLVVHRFLEGAKPFSADEISRALGAPIRLSRQILFELTESAILCRVQPDDAGQPGYQPSRAPQTLTVSFVLDAMEKRGDDSIPVEESETSDKLSATLDSFARTIAASPANALLKDI